MMWFATTPARSARGHPRAAGRQGPQPDVAAARRSAELTPDAAASAFAYRPNPALVVNRDPGDREQRRARRYSRGAALDWFFFIFAGLASIWLAYLSLTESFRIGWWGLLVAVAFWVLLAYLVLPRLHRILTTIYVPEYFIGRARTSDGLLGDPVNLALLGEAEQIHAAMAAADWTRADPVTLALVAAHRHIDSSPAQLPRGARQPALPVRPAAGLRVPAGGGRQPGSAPSRAVLEVPGRVVAARRHPRRLARRGHLRHGRRPVAVHPAGHPPDRRRHRHRARPHRRDDDRRRPAHRGRRRRATSPRATTRATAVATASAPTATSRSSTCGGWRALTPASDALRGGDMNDNKRPAYEPAARLLERPGYDPDDAAPAVDRRRRGDGAAAGHRRRGLARGARCWSGRTS